MMMSETVPLEHNQRIGAVAIGRNEGERLRSCLRSLVEQTDYVVYVDSGSTDDSVSFAKSIGVRVVELDLSIPFTAARARNEGARALLALDNGIQYIQFVDGDCEVQSQWMITAYHFLEQTPKAAIACGRRRERYPDISLYNQLCDIEWNTAIGEAKACGGDALIRVKAYQAVNGYRDDLIAGEEPEMCFRLRQIGWQIFRLDEEMTLHDAAMTKLSQWWKRHERAGHAYAESYFLHGQSHEQFRKKECKSILIWAMILPVMIAVAGISYIGLLSLCLIYPLQIVRLYLQYKKTLSSSKLALLYASSNVFSKWPQLLGMVRFYGSHYSGKRNTIIEYK